LKGEMEFAERYSGWDCFGRAVILKLRGQEVTVKRVELKGPRPEELDMVAEIPIAGELPHGDSKEEKEKRLDYFKAMAYASYALIWYLGPPQGDVTRDKDSWHLIVEYKGHRFWISDRAGEGVIHLHCPPDRIPPKGVIEELRQIIIFLLENPDPLIRAIADLT